MIYFDAKSRPDKDGYGFGLAEFQSKTKSISKSGSSSSSIMLLLLAYSIIRLWFNLIFQLRLFAPSLCLKKLSYPRTTYRLTVMGFSDGVFQTRHLINVDIFTIFGKLKLAKRTHLLSCIWIDCFCISYLRDDINSMVVHLWNRIHFESSKGFFHFNQHSDNSTKEHELVTWHYFPL